MTLPNVYILSVTFCLFLFLFFFGLHNGKANKKKIYIICDRLLNRRTQLGIYLSTWQSIRQTHTTWNLFVNLPEYSARHAGLKYSVVTISADINKLKLKHQYQYWTREQPLHLSMPDQMSFRPKVSSWTSQDHYIDKCGRAVNDIDLKKETKV